MSSDKAQRYVVQGYDAYGNPMVETISYEQPRGWRNFILQRMPARTPDWLWNLCWRVGITKFRRVTKIVVDERPPRPRKP